VKKSGTGNLKNVSFGVAPVIHDIIAATSAVIQANMGHGAIIPYINAVVVIVAMLMPNTKNKDETRGGQDRSPQPCRNRSPPLTLKRKSNENPNYKEIHQ
jgi:hypothetical protein